MTHVELWRHGELEQGDDSKRTISMSADALRRHYSARPAWMMQGSIDPCLLFDSAYRFCLVDADNYADQLWPVDRSRLELMPAL